MHTKFSVHHLAASQKGRNKQQMGGCQVMHTQFSVHHLAATQEGRNKTKGEATEWCTLNLVCVTRGPHEDRHNKKRTWEMIEMVEMFINKR